VTLHPDGRVRVQKVPSDQAIVGTLSEGALCFGTTVATNALLERSGVPTLLLVTDGFGDLPTIGDMTRPSLFEPDDVWPPPLCAHIVEVEGRISADGEEVLPLRIPDLNGVLGDAEAIAIALLNSSRNPDHENRLAKAIAQRHPDLHLSIGHRISPEVGYLARIETTLVDAAITPILRHSMARDQIPETALAMCSDGSLAPAGSLRAPDAVLSGPAGGVLAVAAVAKQAGFARAVGLDMGGTSTDVCRVEHGHLPRREGEVRVAGVRLRRPMLEVETIAAGGGSILWSDGYRLGVGPRSAGADPGPQCYGRGGPPTLTDAALQAGLVDPSRFDPPLDPSAVALPGPADDFLDLARTDMARAIRRLAIARGADLRDHALVAFGGAAGQHAAAVATKLGISTVLFHPCAAVLCAWGQTLARREETAVQPIWAPLEQAWDDVEAAWKAIALTDLGETVHSVELRHEGTDHAIEIVASSKEDARERFLAEHRRRVGFDREQPIEVVNARVRVRAPLATAPEVPNLFGVEVIHGPHVLSTPTTSIVIPDGWVARESQGLLRLEHRKRRPKVAATTRTPHGVSLWSSRFMSVAEQSGARLGRLARSVNIRERLDYSCALFDGGGHLVANAPHIPVHLGAMGATVRDLIASGVPLDRGQSWLTNDPAAGGSHLPDLTVIRAVHHEDERFFVACRGHHVDVGGLTPGSMPPHSRHLSEEGFAVRHLPLLIDGHLRNLDGLFEGCRDMETVRADLEAQLAANALGARRLKDLGSAALIATWMAHLQDTAADLVASRLSTLPTRGAVLRDTVGGVPLVLQLRIEGDACIVDLTGTGGPHLGNLNAPPAVVRAAVLYALRVLVGTDIPLNEGALRHVRILAPSPSIVHPPPQAAVAGGNVETSQRIVDLVLRGASYMASSAGTMSNLTLGGVGWSLYETIGGGQGASPRGEGPSGRQIHMTNTRATDPEVLETRLPLRLHQFRVRKGSGGDGTHGGGDGLIREIEVLAPATASLLASRRTSGAPGLGGRPGRAGKDEIYRQERWQPWNGTSHTLQPGDRVRIFTPGGGGYSPS
jgi:5-oxoprolinase (ATP-hydrolysing)